MSVRRRWLVSRVGALAAGKLAAAAVAGMWVMVAARRLPVATYGDLLLLLGLGLLFLVVNDFGLPLALTDAVSTDAGVARSAYTAVLVRRLALSLVSCALMVGAYAVASGHPDLTAAGIFCISAVSTAVYSTASAVFRASGHIRAEAANDALSRVFVLVVGGWWLFHGGGLRAAVGVYALADAGSAVIMTAMVWHVTAGSTRPVEARRFVLARMGPLGLATGLVVVYYRVDLWLLALLQGTSDVARYGSAYRVLDGVLLAAGAVATLSVAAVARAEAADQQRIVKRLVLLSVVVTAPLALVGLVGAAPIMGGLFGARYAQASGLLRLLLAAAVPSAVVTVLAPLAVLRGRGATVRGLVIALVADIGLNLALVPSMGAAGAAWATLACQVALAAWLLRSVLRWSTPAGPAPSVDGLAVEVAMAEVQVAEVPAATTSSA